MKKLWYFALCLLLVTALMLSFAACESKDSAETTAAPTEPTEPSEPTEPTEPPAIVIGLPKSSNVTDYEDNAYTKWLEEQTGYDIQFKYYAYAAGDYSQQLATEVATNQKLPDILWGFALGNSEIAKYGQKGRIIDLTSLLEDTEKSQVFWEQIQKLRESGYGDFADTILATLRQEGSGAIYAYPTVKTSVVDTMEFMPYINTQWLQNLNLKAPKTPGELVNVLRAFRDYDANNNGNPSDEVPMLGAKTDQLGGNTLEWLINFYIYYDNSTGLNVDDNGKLYAVATQDKYREALKWIKSLIEERLLVTQVLDYTNQDLKALLSAANRVGVTVGKADLIFKSSDGVIMNWEPLDVYGYCFSNEQTVLRRTFITGDCADVDAAWEVLMLMSTWEGAVRQTYGEKGVHWDYADGGAVSVLGMPATIKILQDVKSNAGNETWKTQQAGFYTSDTSELIQPDGDAWSQKKWEMISATVSYQQAAIDRTAAEFGAEHILPALRLTAAEEAMAPQATNLKSEILAYRARFLKGELDINNPAHWEQYLQALERMGLQNYINAYQAAYDRMYPNGHVTAG